MASVTLMQAFELGADALYLSRRPLPTAPDGHYDWETPADAGLSPNNHSGVTNVIQELQTLKTKVSGDRPDPRIVGAFLDTVIHPDSVDDRKGAFAAGLTLLSRLPSSSPAAKDMSNSAVGMLYNTIPHPPAALLGPIHSFRQADGGGNNLQIPDLGRAGQPYARSVQAKWCTAATALPDPGLIFDSILKRRKPVNHPNGNSSLTFAFASLVTHSLFRTDYYDWNKNNTSSYLDLSPLYGIDQSTQDLVRDKAAGRGLLYPDTFSEERLLFLPPAASVLLVILCRNHNYVAERILKINEKKTWTDPPPTNPTNRAAQDEEIFQTARLINGGHFMSLIMGDYVAGFLGLSEGNAWNLDAFDPIKDKNGIEVTRGQGNHVSVEFNVLYRWHATTSQADDKWTQDLLDSKLGGKPLDEIDVKDFATAFGGAIKATLATPPKDRTIGNLIRGPDGKFSDDDLANILQNATENPANSYGGQGTPACLRVVEIMGIQQARQWGVCTMNEFRQYLGLKRFKTFEEWNPDPEIASVAQRLYIHIDNLELYTGLQCEAIMPLSGGLRFACGYTMTRAVLGDAIALIRGDRYYTTGFSPANLTTWGYQDTQRDPNNGGFGGELPKLLMRHLPRHYPFNSVYGCFPFFTPQKMKESLTKQKIADRYTYTRPVPTRIPKVLNTFTGIKYAFNDPSRFQTVYDLKGLGHGYGFMLVFDEAAKHEADKIMILHALFPEKNSLDEYRMWYRDSVAQKIKERSWKYEGVPGTYIDIVNVINATSVHWAADRLCGIPMKTKQNPSGLFTEQEIYDMFAALFQLTFVSIGDNEHGFSLRWTAFQAGGVIQALIAKSILAVAPKSAPGVISGFFAHIASTIWPQGDQPYYQFLSKLAASGRPLNGLIATVISLAVGSCADFAQAAIQVIDVYLDEKREAELNHIRQLAGSKDPSSTELLRGYVREAMRLNPQFTGLWREAVVDALIPQGDGLSPLKVQAGDRIWASFKNAHLDPKEFPNPTTIDPRRPKASYNLNGTGFHNCTGAEYAEQTIAEILRVVFKLQNVRRASGDAGRLSGFTEIVNETENNVFIKPNGTTSPWPGSMYLVYDQ